MEMLGDYNPLGAQRSEAEEDFRYDCKPAERKGIEFSEPMLDEGSAKALSQLKELDVNSMSPLEALNKLNELKGLLNG
jgi:hypothetical protein